MGGACGDGVPHPIEIGLWAWRRLAKGQVRLNRMSVERQRAEKHAVQCFKNVAWTQAE
jgi:hypothetical protein